MAKLLLLMSGVSLGATALYLSLAVKLFRDDKTELVYELNASSVRTLAAQIEASLRKYADKARLLTQGHREPEWARAVFETEPDLVAYTLYRPAAESGEWQTVASIRNPRYLKLYGLDASEIDRVRKDVPVPFARALERKSVAYNSTAGGGAPILTLVVAIQVKGEAVPFVAVLDLRLDKMLELIESRGAATLYVVDSEGRVVAHSDPALVSSRASLGSVAIVREAVESPVAFQLKRFVDSSRSWIGAYAAVGIGGLSVVSQVEEKHAFRAASRLVEKSLLFAAIVVTLSLLLSGWVARGFTLPIQKLVSATERLSRWEFGESVHVGTRDEIASLARSFNAMALDLQRQRAELEGSRAELERKVKERTAALEAEKRQAAEAQDALLRTTRLASLGELAGATAHEILNPLNNMNIRIERNRNQVSRNQESDLKIFAEIVSGWKQAYAQGGWTALETELKKPAADGKSLLEEDLGNLEAIANEELRRSGENRSDFDFIGKELVRVTRIVNNMRSLSRVGGERKPLDVHLAIEDTFATLGDALVKRKVAVVKEFSSDPRDRFAVVGDRDELVQVFSNLVRNAMQAIDLAKRRAGQIRVSTLRRGDRVEIRLVDNGSGISKEHVARIFEPSFTTKSVEEGTGLGLSISRRLVRAFGGDIEVEKTGEGEGTTFLIWFPAYVSPGNS